MACDIINIRPLPIVSA